MTDYTKLDEAIIERIRESGRCDFGRLYADEVAKMADAFAIAADVHKPRHLQTASGFRVVDRRCQSLRKSGRIRFVRGPGAGWEVVDQKGQA